VIAINTLYHFDADKKNLPFCIVFGKGKKDLYGRFLSQYDPRYGFTIIPDGKNHLIFCGGLRFKCILWTYKKEGQPIGFNVKFCDPITQTETIDCATRGISFSNFSKSRIICMDDTEYFPIREAEIPPYVSSMERILSILREHCQKKEKKDGQGNEASLHETYARFWKKQRSIVEAKKEYTKKTLIQLDYSTFETCDTMTADGVLYSFRIEPLEVIIEKNEQRFKDTGVAREEDDPADVKSPSALMKEYSDKLCSASTVILPRAMTTDDNVPGITGTIHSYDASTNILTVEVKNKTGVSSDEIAPAGTICEKMSSDLRKQQETIDSLLNLSDDNKWEGINSVIIDKKIEKVQCLIPASFESDRLTDNQKEAISKALNAKDFLLVQGPPGTGKTTIIVEMIRNLVNLGQKVLVCSKNNLAVDNVLEKWIKENKDRTENHVCVRLTASEDSIKVPLVAEYTPDKVTARIQKRIFENSSAHYKSVSGKIVSDVETIEKERKKLIDLHDTLNYTYSLYRSLEVLNREYSSLLGKSKILEAIGISPAAGSLLERHQETGALLAFILEDLLKPLFGLYTAKSAPSAEAADRIVENYRYVCDRTEKLFCKENVPGFFFSLILKLFGKELDKRKADLCREHLRFCSTEELFCNLRSFPGNSLYGHGEFGALLSSLSPASVTDASVDKAIRDLSVLAAKMDNYHYAQSTKLCHIHEVLSEWHEELLSTKSRQLEQLLVCNSINVVGSTCMSVRSDEDFKDATYDAVIVDEAGQITLHDIIVPLTKAKKVILIGDHLQLPPINEKDFISYYLKTVSEGSESTPTAPFTKEELWDIFNVSLFEKLYNEATSDCEVWDGEGYDPSPKVMINAQYRMHPAISQFISEHFYNGKYTDGKGISAQSRYLSVAGRNKPVYFYDTKDRPDKGETLHDPGCSNELEAEICSDILVDIIDDIENDRYEMRENASLAIRDKAGSIIGYDMGVISGYSKQVELIKEKTVAKLVERLGLSPDEANERMAKFMVNSVDSFQGRDNEIIIFSMTRSNSRGKIGFLRDVRRLNVAMTRAKSMLIIIGDSETLLSSPQPAEHNKSRTAASYYEALIDYCKDESNDFYRLVP